VPKSHFIFLFLTLSMIAMQSPALADSLNSSKTEFENAFGPNVISYPFTNLYQVLKSKIASAPSVSESPAACPVPDGRSLVRKEASFTDPRFVVAFPESIRTVGDHPQGVPPTFIGYAPLSNELEVISWSKAELKYQFLLVKNYKDGGTAEVQKADPSVCLSCHQQGGPIFSRQLWSEAAPYRDDFKKKLQISPEFYQFVDGGGVFDGHVFDANKQIQAIRACQMACGSDLSCRAQLLLGALARNQLSASSDLHSKLSQSIANSVKPNWPADRFSYPSFVLPDRDPLKNSEHHGTVTRIELTDIDAFLKHEAPLSDLVKFQIISEANSSVELTYSSLGSSFAEPDGEVSGVKVTEYPYDDPRSKGDPTLKRPNIDAIPAELSGDYLLDHATDCFALNDSDEAQLKSISFDRLKSITSDAVTARFVSVWPRSSEKIMSYIRARLSNQDVPESLFYSGVGIATSASLPLVSIHDDHSTMPSGDAFQIFKNYCGKCHLGQNALVEDLGINSLDDLKKNESRQLFIDKLNSDAMPADRKSYDSQKIQQWDIDKEILLKELMGS
jgi:hypothetical protein